jgi:2-hydroxychromene-2-carboxylate isomerase
MSLTMIKKDAIFYYDIISPYAYIFMKTRKELQEHLNLKPQAIFFPGLLRLQNNVGPAEVAEKRLHTYTFCVWKAEQLNIPFKFPRRHPFSSIAAQRLLLQVSANWEMLDQAFDFVWGRGGDPETDWSDFCEAIGLPRNTEKPQDDSVKKALLNETQKAAELGVFGVPSVLVDGRVFWGCDSMPWILDYLDRPKMFEEAAYYDALHTFNPLINQ